VGSTVIGVFDQFRPLSKEGLLIRPSAFVGRCVSLVVNAESVRGIDFPYGRDGIDRFCRGLSIHSPMVSSPFG